MALYNVDQATTDFLRAFIIMIKLKDFQKEIREQFESGLLPEDITEEYVAYALDAAEMMIDRNFNAFYELYPMLNSQQATDELLMPIIEHIRNRLGLPTLECP
jgi:hypothetical protein